MTIDVLLRGELPFPGSLPEFQRLFPDEAACMTYAVYLRCHHLLAPKFEIQKM